MSWICLGLFTCLYIYSSFLAKNNMNYPKMIFIGARLALSVEHETLNLRVVGSSPTLGAFSFSFFLLFFTRYIECISVKRLLLFYPASRGLFSVVFAELTGARKRDLCPGSKRTLIQPPPEVVDGAYKSHASCIVG